MTAANADLCIGITIDNYEGTTWDNDRRDRGNWTSGVIGQGELRGTKFGIAAHVYPQLDIKNLTRAEAIAIYKRDYWPKIAGDLLPDGIDLSGYDGTVNSGAGRGRKWLGVGVGSSSADVKTLAELARSAPDKVTVIKKMNAARRSFLIGLHNATYERGWLKRVANVEARSIAMWLAFTKKTPAEVKTALMKEASSSDNKKNGAVAAGGTGATGAGAQASQHEWAFDWGTAIEVALIVGISILVIYAIWKIVEHNNRAKEMRAVAATI